MFSDPFLKRIDLGGSGKSRSTIDRLALLNEQRMERISRESARMREVAIRHIQRMWRGYRSRNHSSMTHSNLLRSRVADLVRILSVIGDKLPILVQSLDKAIGTRNLLTLVSHANADRSDVTRIAEWISWLVATDVVVDYPCFRVRVHALVRCLLKSGCSRESMERLTNSLLGMPMGVIVYTIFQQRNFRSLLGLLSAEIVGRISWKVLENVEVVSMLVFTSWELGSGCMFEASVLMRVKVPKDSFDWDSILVSQMREIAIRPTVSLVRICMQTHPLASLEGRNRVQLILLDHLIGAGGTDWTQFLLELVFTVVDFSSLPEETLFRLAMSSGLLAPTAQVLVKGLESMDLDSVERFLRGFVSLFSTLLGGMYSASSSVIPMSTMEALFPLLNLHAFRLVTAGQHEQWLPTLALVRSVYEKKILFPSLREEAAWIVPESRQYVSGNVDSFELVDRWRVAEEQEEEEEVVVEESGVNGVSEQSSLPQSITSQPSMHRLHPTVGRIFENLIEFLPHTLPFADRVGIFTAALAEDQRRQMTETWRSRWAVRQIRRDHLVEDGLSLFDSVSLRELVRVEFVGEAGIDGGGLFKEFMHLWTKSVMDPQFGLFSQLEGTGRLSPAVDAFLLAHADHLFRAAGRAVGKALYEMVLLETHLGEAFLARVIGRSVGLEQLLELDPSLYRNLKFVHDAENVELLGLTFSAGTDHELIAGGSEIAVTNTNKVRYVLLAAWFHLSRRLDRAAAAFGAGLNDVVPLSWLRMFSPKEINILISGDQRTGFSVSDLAANVVYGGGYFENSPTIQHLWEVLSEFGPKDQAAFLAFVTSSPRPPLLGFKVLVPKFAINRVPEPDRLPTASTCTNLLKLPDYRNKDLLRSKLIAAINSHSGFDLS